MSRNFCEYPGRSLHRCADFPCESQSQPLVAVISVLRNPPVRKLHPLKLSALSRDTITTAISTCAPLVVAERVTIAHTHMVIE
jgi:hypothetical protein